MKIFTSLFAAVAVLWTSSVAAETTISIFYAWPGHKVFHEAVAEAFMEQNPDIKVEFRAPANNYDEAMQTIIRQSFSNQQADVHFIGYNLLREIVNRKLVANLDPLVATEDMKALGFEDTVLALGKVKDVQYGLPATVSTPVLHYNADLVRKAGGNPDKMPATWDETIKLGGRISALSDNEDGMYFLQNPWFGQILIMNHGISLMNDDETELAFDGPVGVEVFKLLRRFHDEGGQPAIEGRAARQQFNAGKLGMFFGSTSFVKEFGKNSAGKFDYRTAVLPLAVENAKMPFAGMASVILTKEPERQKAAWEYIKFFSGPTGQEIVVRNTGYMPTNRLALGEEYLGSFYKEMPNWATSVKQIPLAQPWFSFPGENNVKIGQVITDNMVAVAHNQKKPEEAVADMANGIRKLLPKK